MVKLPDEDAVPLPRKGSILRAASALAGGLDEQVMFIVITIILFLNLETKLP